MEDSDEDYVVLSWALKKAEIVNPLYRCKNASDIAALLTDRSRWPAALSASYPLIILMDLNIPGTNWRETFSSLRADPWWQMVPVIIVSTSAHPSDVSACYRMGAAGYLLKPLDLAAFARTMRTVADYWIREVVPPGPPDSEILLPA
jgi:DNA-binding NarL/FixJ family response regulator